MEVLTPPALPLAEWLGVVEREYLIDLVASGGAAVKMALGDDAAVVAGAEQLQSLAASHGMLAIHVDSAKTRVSLMHELFFAVARALPWDALLQSYVERLFAAREWPWPRPGARLTTADLATHFGVAPPLLARHLDQWLTADLWDDRRMAQDVRAALLHLCLAWLAPDGADLSTPVMQWLRGEKVLASQLRAADVTTRIGRTNARPALASVCRFARKAGSRGLMLVLDARQLARAAAAEGLLRYSPAAVMDAYEVLRELIDGAEDTPGLFVVVLANADLATGDPRRALSQYAALQMRVWPDVRPGDRQNPVAPLVWLAA